MRDNTTSQTWSGLNRESSSASRDICLRDFLGISSDELKRSYTEVNQRSGFLENGNEGSSKDNYWNETQSSSPEALKARQKRRVLSNETATPTFSFGSFMKPRINIEAEDMTKFPEHYNPKFIKEVLSSKHPSQSTIMEPHIRRGQLEKLSVIELDMDKYFKSLRQY